MRDITQYIKKDGAFLICAVVLAVSGITMSVIVEKFKVFLKKEPVLLKRSLDLLDKNDLGPYRVVAKDKIENEEILQKLGTRDYIQWVLEDTNTPVDSPVRKCLLFITYYGLPDRVPHVPEECYTGGGYQNLGSEGITLEISNDQQHFRRNLSPEKVTLEVQDNNAVNAAGENVMVANREIPAKYIAFGIKNRDGLQFGEDSAFPILYFFSVNGSYANGREEVRRILNENIFGKYSYFSKVEWKFFNTTAFGAAIYPKKEEAVKASGKLLSVILPILEKEYWPELKKM